MVEVIVHVTITAEDGYLVVSNPIRPLLEPEVGTGTGLQNLNSRYLLMLGSEIVVENDGEKFVVKLPLKRV